MNKDLAICQEDNTTNKFIEQTKLAIKNNVSPDFIKKRLGGFHGNYINGNGNKGILVMGLNPAGNEETVAQEFSHNNIFLNYIANVALPGFTNTTYFKPIYDFANHITGTWTKEEIL